MIFLVSKNNSIRDSYRCRQHSEFLTTAEEITSMEPTTKASPKECTCTERISRPKRMRKLYTLCGASGLIIHKSKANETKLFISADKFMLASLTKKVCDDKDVFFDSKSVQRCINLAIKKLNSRIKKNFT